MRSFPLDPRPRGRLLLLGALLCGAAGCYTEADRFNERAAELVCSYNAQDPERPIVSDRTERPATIHEPFPDRIPYGGPHCEDHVLDDLAHCPGECEYNPSAARRCIRRLRRADRTGSYDEGMLAPCLSVYECPEDTHGTCSLSDGCSMSDRPKRGGWALLLLVVAGLRPLRRWRRRA